MFSAPNRRLLQVVGWLSFFNLCVGREKDLAIEQLASILKVPGYLSYGELYLHSFWDPLRGDPRFEKIVASLAPKE